jgi:hypothetical protein
MNQDLFAQAMNYQNDTSSHQGEVDYNDALQLAALGLNPSMVKGSKLQKKAKQNNAKNHRAGDWVCILCNNLNYSFRHLCNRCQLQTKKQNLLQALMCLNDPNAQLNNPQGTPPQVINAPPGIPAGPRKPFTDITNQNNGASQGYSFNNGRNPMGGRKGQNPGQMNAQTTHSALFSGYSAQNSNSNFQENQENQNMPKANLTAFNWITNLQHFPEELTQGNYKPTQQQNFNSHMPQTSQFTPETVNPVQFLPTASHQDEPLSTLLFKSQTQRDPNASPNLTSNASTTTTRSISREEESKTNKKQSSKQCQGFNLAIFLNECLITPKKSKNLESSNLPYKSPDQLPPICHLLQRIQDSDSKTLENSNSRIVRSFNSTSVALPKSQRKISETLNSEENLDLEDDEYNVIIDLSRKLTMEEIEPVTEVQSQKSY